MRVIKIAVSVLTVLILLRCPSYGQDREQLLNEVSQMVTGDQGTGHPSLGGFSVWSLVGNILFSSIGFIAFVYGKKNAEFRPMIIGGLLMAYPYFIGSTVAMYAVGAGLMAALYFFRE